MDVNSRAEGMLYQVHRLTVPCCCNGDMIDSGTREKLALALRRPHECDPGLRLLEFAVRSTMLC